MKSKVKAGAQGVYAFIAALSISIFFPLCSSVQTDFFKAIEDGELEKVKKFVEKDRWLLEEKKFSGNTPLHEAVDALELRDENGNPCAHPVETMKYLLSKKPDLLNVPNNKGETPLFCACNNVVTNLVRKKIEELVSHSNIDVNVQTNSFPGGNTALHAAAEYGDEKVVKDLVGKGALINVQNAKKQTPLCIACEHNKNAVIKHLIEKRANPNLPDAQGNYPIHHVLNPKNLNITGLTILLESDSIDVRLPDKGGKTPLEILEDAFFNTGPEVIPALVMCLKKMVDKGADLNLPRSDKLTLFQKAVKERHPVLIRTLLGFPQTDIKQGNKDGLSLLQEVVAQGSYYGTHDFFSLIPSRLGLSMNGSSTYINALSQSPGLSGKRAPEHPASLDESSVIKFLVYLQETDDSQDKKRFVIAERLNSLTLRMLLADPRISSQSDEPYPAEFKAIGGLTPLQVAASKGDGRMIQELMSSSQKPSVDAPIPPAGMTPLLTLCSSYSAFRNGYNRTARQAVAAIREMLADKQSYVPYIVNGVSMVGGLGFNLLSDSIPQRIVGDVTAAFGKEVFSTLLASEDIESAFRKGIKTLLINNASPDVVHQKDGKTPLHYFIESIKLNVDGSLAQTDQEILQLFISKGGPDIFKKQDNLGNTWLHSAAAAGKNSLIKVLLQYLYFHTYYNAGDLLSMRNNEGHTAFHCAVKSGDLSTFKRLLNSDALLNLPVEIHNLIERNTQFKKIKEAVINDSTLVDLVDGLIRQAEEFSRSLENASFVTPDLLKGYLALEMSIPQSLKGGKPFWGHAVNKYTTLDDTMNTLRIDLRRKIAAMENDKREMLQAECQDALNSLKKELLDNFDKGKEFDSEESQELPMRAIFKVLHLYKQAAFKNNVPAAITSQFNNQYYRAAQHLSFQCGDKEAQLALKQTEPVTRGWHYLTNSSEGKVVSGVALAGVSVALLYALHASGKLGQLKDWIKYDLAGRYDSITDEEKKALALHLNMQKMFNTPERYEQNQARLLRRYTQKDRDDIIALMQKLTKEKSSHRSKQLKDQEPKGLAAL